MQDFFFLRQFQTGNKKVFKQIFDTYYQRLVLFAQKMLNDFHIAEDLVQESFIVLWDKKEEIHDIDKIKAFLYVNVKNRCLNYLRDQKIREEHLIKFCQEQEGSVLYENALIEEETWNTLIQTLDQLGNQTKKVCFMSMEGIKNAEIADQLNISVSTVKYHKNQAKQLLNKFMKNIYSLLY